MIWKKHTIALYKIDGKRMSLEGTNLGGIMRCVRVCMVAKLSHSFVSMTAALRIAIPSYRLRYETRT